jgi:hypothetical protein
MDGNTAAKGKGRRCCPFAAEMIAHYFSKRMEAFAVAN